MKLETKMKYWITLILIYRNFAKKATTNWK
jgi:hypothetical protein